MKNNFQPLFNTRNDILSHFNTNDLESLYFDIITEKDFEEEIARLAVLVPPVYLPIARDSNGVLAFHLLPERDINNSPICYIYYDEHEVKFVSDSIRTLPKALMLWNSAYFEDEEENLKTLIKSLIASIPNSTPFDDSLFEQLDFEESCRWNAQEKYPNYLWDLAKVGHPFAGIQIIDFYESSDVAIEKIKAFIKTKESPSPHLFATLFSSEFVTGNFNQPERLINVFNQECWYHVGSPIYGIWRSSGKGISDWDSILKNWEGGYSEIPEPYIALFENPNTYSGQLKRGPGILIDIGNFFVKKGQFTLALNQFRNAMLLHLIIFDEPSKDIINRIVSVTEKKHPNSLANLLTQYTLSII